MPRPLSVVIGGVLLLVTSATAWSQPPPSSYPIQGRFACLGYDRDLAAVGDLGSALPGGMGGGQNNGFFYVYPSRNVTYSVADGAWDVELGIWTGTNYVWVRSIEPGEQCAYYPEVLGSLPDPHAWLVGPLDTSALWPTGWLRVHTYDGTLKIPGDAYGGIPHDGILFALPAQQAHIIRGATPMWHLQIQVTNTLGVLEWVWAVYPKAMSHVDVTP